MKPSRTALWLLLLLLLTLGLRLGSWREVFPGEGSVVLAPADSAYHARRALYSFVNFPDVLVFDPYVAWPDGARVPMPPLYDWAVGGAGRLLGDTEAAFERVAAWVSPAAAALTVLPVFFVGRAVGGSGVGLGAALVFALLPGAALRSRLGDVDHHATVALLGALWLALSVRSLRPGPGGGRLAVDAVLLAFVRAALILSWSGSLLYVAVGEGALIVASAVDGRRRLLVAQACGAAGAALLTLPWLLGAPPAERFTATDVSWLHVVAWAAVAVLAGGLALSGPRWAAAGPARRLAALTLAALALVGLLLAVVPDLSRSGQVALGFVAKEGGGEGWAEANRMWGAQNAEQRGLLAAPGVALRHYGWLALLIPVTPLAALAAARDPRRRSEALCLAGWTACLGAMAVAQSRFVSDFAPVGAVGFALVLAALVAAVARAAPRVPRGAVAAALLTVLLWPGASHLVRQTLRTFGPPSGGFSLSPRASIIGFAQLVREATPETAGFLEPGARPEYGVLVPPSFGHTFHYAARRATPANNFGPWLERDRFLRAQRFYAAPEQERALAIAEALGVRYVMTNARERRDPPSFAERLHAFDAAVGRDAPNERLRLVVEGPYGGRPLLAAFPSGEVPPRSIPYKLFELVPGAVLEGAAPPGAEMEVRVQVATNLGRRLPFRARAVADADGYARARVPYPTDATAPTRSVGPYRVTLEGREYRVEVSEREVRTGSRVPVGPASAGLRPRAPRAAPAPASSPGPG